MNFSEKVYLGAFASLLQIILLSNLPVLAAPKYNPPTTGRQDDDSTSSGSRGCDQASASTSFSLLVPKDHVGLTTSSHPTFLWYLSSKIDVPMRFTLVEQQVEPPIFETQLSSVQPGIIQLTVPAKMPSLEYGKQYRWTVSLVCNEKRPSQNSYASALIKRVVINNESSKQIQPFSSINNYKELASIYAGLGIWYDAIANSYHESISKNKNGMLQDFVSLLNQIGLSNTVNIQNPQNIDTQVSVRNKYKK